MTDTELANQLARDVDGSFALFVDATKDRLFGGLRLICGNDAEDVTQEAYLKAYRALKTYDAGRIKKLQCRSWLWTIALNTSRNAHRSRTRKPEVITDQLPEQASDAADLPDESIMVALAELTTHQSRAVVLHHVLGFTYGEVATITERAVGTVKSDVSRGLASLRTKGIEA